MKARALHLLSLLTIGASIGVTMPAMSSPVFQVTAPFETIYVGNTFTVNVSALDATDLYGYQFDLRFDPGLMTIVTETEGLFLNGGGSTFFIPGNVTGGTIEATANSLVGPVGGVSGSGLLAQFQFQAIASGTGDYSLSNLYFFDSAFNLVDVESLEGSLPGTTAKVGFYLRGDDTSFTDVGLKTSQTFGFGAASVDSPANMELGLADAIACPFGACY